MPLRLMARSRSLVPGRTLPVRPEAGLYTVARNGIFHEVTP